MDIESVADFALVVLAAYGVDALFSPRPDGWEPLDKPLKWVALACLVPLGVHAVYAQPPLSPWVSLFRSAVITGLKWIQQIDRRL